MHASQRLHAAEVGKVSQDIEGHRCNRARNEVARAVPRRILWTTDSVEVDGQALALTKVY